MSRSYKKNGIIKDRPRKPWKYYKILRRRNKVLLQKGMQLKKMYEVINPWQVSDYSFHVDHENFSKGFDWFKKQKNVVEILPYFKK